LFVSVCIVCICMYCLYLYVLFVSVCTVCICMYCLYLYVLFVSVCIVCICMYSLYLYVLFHYYVKPDNLSSFMTYHYVLKMSSTTGANSVAGTEYHPVLPAFNLCFSCRSVLSFLFCVVFCGQLIIFVLFSILTVVLSVLYIFKIF
jgi:hypothetical protein